MNSRSVAARIIKEWLETGNFPDRMIGDDTRDRAFVMEVVYGICRWKRTLLWAINECATREPDTEVLPFLLVGAYQLLKMDNVEDYAALNETVEAVKESPVSFASGFVNGVLRQIQRTASALNQALETQPLAIRESHPDILVKRWMKTFGEEKTISLCKWNNNRSEITIRLNTNKTDMTEFTKLLQTAGINCKSHSYAPDSFITIQHGTRVPDIPGFDNGLFSVQDPSTSIAVSLLDPQPGNRILDACSAPGGKTIIIAEKMDCQGTVIAMDLHEDRLPRLTENINRLALDRVRVVQGDASLRRDLERVAEGDLFDRILLDVPCSNTGVLSRRPDARWRFSIDRQKKLIRKQQAILRTCSSYLKPAGMLVYSTCSLEQEENEELIDAWLAENHDFELIKSIKLLPPETNTDGAYAAVLKKLTG